jgi:hypothetical protein
LVREQELVGFAEAIFNTTSMATMMFYFLKVMSRPLYSALLWSSAP